MQNLLRTGNRQGPRLAALLVLLSTGLITACSAGHALADTGAAPRSPTAPVVAGSRATSLPVAMVWQSNGAPRRLRLPTALAIDGSGRLLVVDAGNDRIQAIAGAERPSPWGSSGSGPGQFRFRDASDFAEPFSVSIILGGGLAIDARGDSYVADPLNARVQKFDATGRLVAIWGGDGLAGARFQQPVGVAVDSEGAVYVADQGSHRVLKLDSDGRLLLQWGGLGSEPGALNAPMALTVDRRGQVYVADRGNARIQQFDRAGRFVRAWGGRGAGAGEFASDIFLAVDAQGHVYASDSANHRVQVFSGDGIYLAEWGRLGVDEGEFAYAGGIVVDGQGDVYVADIYNGRIQRFHPRMPWPAASRATPTPRPAPPPTAPVTPPLLTPTDR